MEQENHNWMSVVVHQNLQLNTYTVFVHINALGAMQLSKGGTTITDKKSTLECSGNGQ